eukprot:scaffold102385_cov63-Phaeocystis_antarctica.AAC.2
MPTYLHACHRGPQRRGHSSSEMSGHPCWTAGGEEKSAAMNNFEEVTFMVTHCSEVYTSGRCLIQNAIFSRAGV